jgi:hypothetical protein
LGLFIPNAFLTFSIDLSQLFPLSLFPKSASHKLSSYL